MATPSLASILLKQLETGDEIHDYQHASRMYVDSLYRLGPKSQTLFHVFMDVNPAFMGPVSDATNSLISPISNENLIEIGMLAKQVSLPKFSVQTKVYNAYNRKNIAQEKINYDPVSITFHDDSANVIRDFWHRYYSFYYRDSDHQESVYTGHHKYQPRQADAWGFSPMIASGELATNYIKTIRIYSLHQKSFSSYILINPMIKEFGHGEHQAGQYETMQHTMTVEYESVIYESGPVHQETVRGWNVIHYDNTPSPLTPIGGGTTSFLGPGGAAEALADVVTNVSSGNFAGAALGALRVGSNWKNADIKAVAASEFTALAKNVLRGQNVQSSVFLPTRKSILDGLSKAVSRTKPPT